MNVKRLIPTLALLVSVVGLSACSEADQKLEFNRYWNDNAQVSETVTERAEYSVAFEPDANPYVDDYKISYSDGKYVTLLTTNDDGTYTYETDLSIKVTYTFGQDSVTKEDFVKTKLVFNDVSKSLKPITVEKEIYSHSPTNASATKLDDCYTKFHYKLESTYSQSDDSASCKITNLKNAENPAEETKNFSITNEKYSYLDNDQILFGLRAVSSTVTSAKIVSYSPFFTATQEINLSFSSETGGEFSYTKNGTAVKENISYRPATVQINAKNPGETQTVWIATPSSTGSNLNHNVMLRYEAPIPYSLGKLVYSLNSLEYDNGL